MSSLNEADDAQLKSVLGDLIVVELYDCLNQFFGLREVIAQMETRPLMGVGEEELFIHGIRLKGLRAGYEALRVPLGEIMGLYERRTSPSERQRMQVLLEGR